MRHRGLPLLALAVLLSGCMTPEQQRAADEERCRNYGFKNRNDAFAQCMQRLDFERRARTYVSGFAGAGVAVID